MPDQTIQLPLERFRLQPALPRDRLLLRGRPAALQAAAAWLGIAAPDTLQASGSGLLDALWLGPDEWLLLIPGGEVRERRAALSAAIGPHPHSLVDISDRQLGYGAQGHAVEAVLNAGCPLDLTETAFPVGMSTRTVLAKTEIVLWRQGPSAFHIEVWRSFAPYLAAYLSEVSRDGAEP